MSLIPALNGPLANTQNRDIPNALTTATDQTKQASKAAGVSQATPWVAYLNDITSGLVQVEEGFHDSILPNPNGWTLAFIFSKMAGLVGLGRSALLA